MIYFGIFFACVFEGVTAHKDILRLVATLLVLQLMKVDKLEEGKLLRTLFCLEEASQSRSVQHRMHNSLE